MGNFRLLTFEYENFNEKVNYEFSPESEQNYSLPYSTLLIGSNGTGKSRLLRALADVFNDLYLFYNDNNELFATKKEYVLIYLLNGKKYKFIKFGVSGLHYEIDDQRVSFDKMKLPSKLICISYNISDKFPVTFSSPLQTRKDRYENDFYSYLGIKVQRNSATPLGHIYRMLDLLTSSVGNHDFTTNARAVFDFLNLDPVIKIEYRLGTFGSRRNFLSGDLNRQKFIDIVSENRQQNNSDYSVSTFDKLLGGDPDFLDHFIKYLNRLSGKKAISEPVIFDFQKEEFIDRDLEVNYKFLNLARRLKILTYRDISLWRGQNEFSIRDSSSGQSHILTSMLSLASVIKENSLILIDEPETSLHPNWQLKYFELVNTIFKRFSSCHFVVASHSHFFGSDLRPSSSSILSLTINDNFQVESRLLPFETFGWSAEQILLTVFKAPTTRNYYVAERVGEILNLVSKSKRDESKIKAKVIALKTDNLLQLSSEDPLKDVIIKLIEKYAQG